MDTQLGMLSHTDRGPPPRERFLEEDRLLTALLNDSENGRVSGRSRGSFGSTFNRKTKKKKLLYTQLLTLYPALLDDYSPGMVQLMLQQIHHWEFNAFHLDRFSSGHSLSTLCVHLFHSLGLISSFAMDPAEVFAFFRLVERGYQSGNPYHTSLHAADVTQAIAVFCNQPCIANHLSKLELLAVLTAAVCHDLDHPGVNEKFLVSTGSHLAVLYDNVSVLENHHWRSAIACFVESGLTKYITETQFAEFTDLVRSLVLATDISRQQEFLTQFRYFLDSSELDTSQLNHRHFVLQIAIKCADISNPCRTWPVSRLWSLRACEEFFRQGDNERDLGLLLTPICDRFNVTVAKVQVGFYRFVAEPLFKEWHRFLNCPLSEAMLKNLYSNQAVWEGEVLQEEVNSVETPTKPEVEDCPPIHVFTHHHQPVQPKLSSLQRRLSLPATDPLHRIFDQMTQPDNELPRAAHLRRNFSLTDRRRSSLLRGLHNRSSLKPIRGRVNRPASVCLENTENIRINRTLQSRENRLSDQYCMDVSAEEPTKCNTNSAKSENMSADLEKENSGLHSALQTRLTKRRGSAPSNLVLGDCRIPSNTPSNIIKQQNCLTINTRRGSLPSELLNNSLPKQLRNRVIANPNSGNKRPGPGLLRRRSMGPELLSLGTAQLTKERQLVQKYLNRPF
jgi:hypothetical protein